MESLFKRYRFRQDLHSDDDLIILANSKFIETQNRISSEFKLTERVQRVLKLARHLVGEILGPYDHFEHARSCRFGKRSSVGVLHNDSYLDIKSATLSGSQDHIEWFRYHLGWDEQLSQALVAVPYVATMERCEVLNLTTVPKTFKARRTILKNTTIGAFYTSGIGKMLQRRLKAAGLNIRRQQSKHRRWIAKFSRTLSHATADLSAASDSFTDQHALALLPDDWYKAICYGRINRVEVGGKEIELKSFMTMGLGFTFPLQTLLFYCLLKAIASLSEVNGRISVYGDDLIYPTQMHRYVRSIFTDIGFLLNEDKTFTDLYFRESCGADFYCGTDVRPFQPEGQYELCSGPQYEMLVYKTINGLMLRWCAEEIPRTLDYLKSELFKVTDVCCQVPPSFPETTGIRVKEPVLHPGFSVVKSRGGTFGVYHFTILATVPKQRYVHNQYIYLWERLRSVTHLDDEEVLHNQKHFVADRDYGGSFVDIHTPLLRWKKVKHNRKNYRSSLTGARLPRLLPFVPCKRRGPDIKRERSTNLDWI